MSIVERDWEIFGTPGRICRKSPSFVVWTLSQILHVLCISLKDDMSHKKALSKFLFFIVAIGTLVIWSTLIFSRFDRLETSHFSV